MLALYSLQQLINQVRQRADMEGSTFVTDAEILDLLLQSLSDLHDILIAADGEGKYAQKRIQLATVVPNAGVPDGAGAVLVLPDDFYRLVSLVWRYQDDWEIPLEPWNPAERVAAHRARSWSPSYPPRYQLRRYQSSATGTTPAHSGLTPKVWAVYFDPMPSAQAQTLLVHYIVRGPVLNDQGSLGSNPDAQDVVDMPFTKYAVLDVAMQLLDK